MDSIFINTRTLPKNIQIEHNLLEFSKKYSFIHKSEKGWNFVVQNSEIHFGYKSGKPRKTLRSFKDRIGNSTNTVYYESLPNT